ncbi:MAG: glycosyltransferase, partial [Nocardioidaceae bacterium]
MRILVVTNLFPTETSPHGGVFIAHRVRALRAEGHHVTAVALDLSRGPLPRRQRALALTPPGLDDVFVRLSVPLSLPARVALRLGRFDGVVDHVAEFLDQWRGGTTFDVVHAHGMYPPMPAGAVAKNLAARFGIGYVVTCHGSDITLMTARNRPRYVDVLA